MSDFSVTFLTRKGCHLCDEARPVLARAAGKLNVRVTEVDIDADDRLTRDYGLRVPVLLDPEGRVVAEGVIDDARVLRRILRQGLGL